MIQNLHPLSFELKANCACSNLTISTKREVRVIRKIKEAAELRSFLYSRKDLR